MNNQMKPFVALTVLACSLGLGSVAHAFDLGSAIGAAENITKAATLSDADVKKLAKDMAALSDKENKVAAKTSAQSKRLDQIVAKFKTLDGMTLNYKVYIDKDINAFALPDGSVRVNSGLLDAYTDDEVRFVIGHEIGHVALGHSRKRLQTAYTTAAARSSASAFGNENVATLSDSAVGDMIEGVIKAQFSQSNESESDAYAVKFMKRFKFDPNAAETALAKMITEESEGGGGLFSTHPATKDRIERVKQEVAASK